MSPRPAGGGGRAGHRHLRAGLPGLVRVPHGHAPRPGRAVRGHHRVDVRHPALRRVGARPAGPRRESGRGGEQGDPGADHPGPRHLRRRDPAPRRAGAEDAKKKYLQVACTSLLTYYFLGDRDLPSFKDFIYSDLHGTVIVHDRYVNYDHFDGVAHQLCTAHLLRDLEDAAQAYPDAVWPGQIAGDCAPSSTRRTSPATPGLAAVPEDATAEHLRLFRHGVTVGPVAMSAASPAAQEQPPGRSCWNASSTARTTCCGSSPTPRSRPPTTRPNATCAPPKPSRRSAAGSAPRKPPGTGTPSAATHPPPSSTDTTPSPPSATPSPGTPGCHPSPPRLNCTRNPSHKATRM